jgi:hypothetical protein
MAKNAAFWQFLDLIFANMYAERTARRHPGSQSQVLRRTGQAA